MLFLALPEIGLAQVKIIEKDARETPGAEAGEANFIEGKGAKDCVFDHIRKLLYVTTLSQLIVVDMTNRKVIESIDLSGRVQGLDIPATAKFLVITPIAAQYLYKMDLD